MQIFLAPRPALTGWATGKSKPTHPSTFQEQVSGHTEITRGMEERERFLLCNLDMPRISCQSQLMGTGWLSDS